MSTKDGVTHNVHTPVKTSKKRKCGLHCKKFWWAYLIGFICIVVLVVCLIIFVGVPNIAQDKLNEAELEVQSVSILDTESDSYVMEIDSTIRTDGSIHAKVDSFLGNMFLEGADPYVPFASLHFPETSSAKEQLVNVSQRVEINDMDAFRQFNIEFVKRESLNIVIEGDTRVKPSGLDRWYGVNFKKTLETKALNTFKGTEVIEETARLELVEDDEGKNFWGEAEIPNPSHFTLDIGNVTFINFVGDENVGTLFIDNLMLHPGTNRVNISANMDQSAVIDLLRSDDYCKTGVIPFKLQGENVTNHGQDLSYFAAGLASVNQTVEIDIGLIVENNLGTTIKCAGDSKDEEEDEEESEN